MTIFGSDVSHYDAPDTRAMFADGIVFQTHKAGGDSNDPELGQWWNYVRGYRDRVLLGAYWVLRPDRWGSALTAADAFLARLDSQCSGWRDLPFILQADCEKWSGDARTVPSVGQVNAFGDRLKAKVPALTMIAYMPDWAYGDISALRYPLWSSKYVSTPATGYRTMYPGDDSSLWAPYGGIKKSQLVVLQYTSSATIGGQTTCDANAYRGTLAELTALLAPGFTKGSDIMSTTDDLVNALTSTTVFTDSQGGSYSPVGNGVLRSSYPRRLDTDSRTPVWKNLQGLQNDIDRVLAGIAGLPAAILAALADAARSDQEVADALKAVLGDRAVAIGHLLSE